MFVLVFRNKTVSSAAFSLRIDSYESLRAGFTVAPEESGSTTLTVLTPAARLDGPLRVGMLAAKGSRPAVKRLSERHWLGDLRLAASHPLVFHTPNVPSRGQIVLLVTRRELAAVGDSPLLGVDYDLDAAEPREVDVFVAELNVSGHVSGSWLAAVCVDRAVVSGECAKGARTPLPRLTLLPAPRRASVLSLGDDPLTNPLDLSNGVGWEKSIPVDIVALPRGFPARRVGRLTATSSRFGMMLSSSAELTMGVRGMQGELIVGGSAHRISLSDWIFLRTHRQTEFGAISLALRAGEVGWSVSGRARELNIGNRSVMPKLIDVDLTLGGFWVPLFIGMFFTLLVEGIVRRVGSGT